MPNEATISADILARYAADAAREVEGVHGLAASHIPGRHGVRVEGKNGALRIELHLVADWGAPIPALGARVQARVREYLLGIADVEPASIDVVVDAVE